MITWKLLNYQDASKRELGQSNQLNSIPITITIGKIALCVRVLSMNLLAWQSLLGQFAITVQKIKHAVSIIGPHNAILRLPTTI